MHHTFLSHRGPRCIATRHFWQCNSVSKPPSMVGGQCAHIVLIHKTNHKATSDPSGPRVDPPPHQGGDQDSDIPDDDAFHSGAPWLFPMSALLWHGSMLRSGRAPLCQSWQQLPPRPMVNYAITGNGSNPISMPSQLGCCKTALFLPHLVHRAERRSKSLDTSGL